MSTYLSLFTGAGGLDLGLDTAGWTCTGQAEIDATCRAVLARHWPNVHRWDDVRAVDGADSVDLIAGGFPCQDVSVAGRRAGLAGDRSGLWWEFHRIVDALRPRAVLVENVEGLLSSNGGRDLGAIIDALADLGYGVAWRVLDAQHFGVPQRRRRVFLLALTGGRAGAERAAEVLALTPGSSRDPQASRRPRPGTAGGPALGVVGALAGRSASRLDDACAGGGQLVPVVSTLQAPKGRGWRVDAEGAAGAAGGQIIPNAATGARRLTPRECERLMGWPDDHTRYRADGTEIADSRRYAMCGKRRRRTGRRLDRCAPPRRAHPARRGRRMTGSVPAHRRVRLDVPQDRAGGTHGVPRGVTRLVTLRSRKPLLGLSEACTRGSEGPLDQHREIPGRAVPRPCRGGLDALPAHELRLGEQVPVGGQRQGRGGVAQPFGDLQDGEALRDPQGRRRVPEVVRRRRRPDQESGGAPHVLAPVVLIQGTAHQVTAGTPAMRLEVLTDRRDDRDAPRTLPAGLRRTADPFAAAHHDRRLHHIPPPQGTHLPWPQAPIGHEADGEAVAGGAHRCADALHLPQLRGSVLRLLHRERLQAEAHVDGDHLLLDRLGQGGRQVTDRAVRLLGGRDAHQVVPPFPDVALGEVPQPDATQCRDDEPVPPRAAVVERLGFPRRPVSADPGGEPRRDRDGRADGVVAPCELPDELLSFAFGGEPAGPPVAPLAPLDAPRLAWPVLPTDRRHGAQGSATAQTATSLCESLTLKGGVVPDRETATSSDGGCGDRTRDLLLAKAQHTVQQGDADGTAPGSQAGSDAAAATRHRTTPEPTSETHPVGACRVCHQPFPALDADVRHLCPTCDDRIWDILEAHARSCDRSDAAHSLRVRDQQVAGEQRHVRRAVHA